MTNQAIAHATARGTVRVAVDGDAAAPALVLGNDELHDILSKLPLFPYMKIIVTPLAKHPSAIA